MQILWVPQDFAVTFLQRDRLFLFECLDLHNAVLFKNSPVRRQESPFHVGRESAEVDLDNGLYNPARLSSVSFAITITFVSTITASINPLLSFDVPFVLLSLQTSLPSRHQKSFLASSLCCQIHPSVAFRLWIHLHRYDKNRG